MEEWWAVWSGGRLCGVVVGCVEWWWAVWSGGKGSSEGCSVVEAEFYVENLKMCWKEKQGYKHKQ